ncbi:MAG TPA: hypothetical protein VKR23_10400, partial [Gaiellaceae bacterium]|nr:hypothetical protein [Gaiellaceae bacterium]
SERFDLDQLEILCECARVGCVDRIELSALAYERARQSGTTFIVLLSHADSSIERIVFHGDSYAFVEKIGDAASVAEATDPR